MADDPRIDSKISRDLSGVKSQDGGTDPKEASFASTLTNEIVQRNQMMERQEQAADAEVQLTRQRKALRRWFGIAGIIFVAVLVLVHITAVAFIMIRYEGCTSGDSSCFAASGVFIAVVVAPLASATIFLVTMAHATFQPRRPTEFADFGSIPGIIGKLTGKAKDAALD